MLLLRKRFFTDFGACDKFSPGMCNTFSPASWDLNCPGGSPACSQGRKPLDSGVGKHKAPQGRQRGAYVRSMSPFQGFLSKTKLGPGACAPGYTTLPLRVNRIVPHNFSLRPSASSAVNNLSFHILLTLLRLLRRVLQRLQRLRVFARSRSPVVPRLRPISKGAS